MQLKHTEKNTHTPTPGDIKTPPQTNRTEISLFFLHMTLGWDFKLCHLGLGLIMGKHCQESPVWVQPGTCATNHSKSLHPPFGFCHSALSNYPVNIKCPENNSMLVCLGLDSTSFRCHYQILQTLSFPNRSCLCPYFFLWRRATRTQLWNQGRRAFSPSLTKKHLLFWQWACPVSLNLQLWR